MTNDLEKRVSEIENRNRLVEVDKQWETSLLRRVLITVLTYVLVSTYLIATSVERPLLTAVVPALGYFLSTLILRGVKDRYQNKNRRG